MNLKTRLDYVEFYARKLRENNLYFKQYKMFIESQMKASQSLFKNSFGQKDFKEKAREYVKRLGLIRTNKTRLLNWHKFP